MVFCFLCVYRETEVRGLFTKEWIQNVIERVENVDAKDRKEWG